MNDKLNDKEELAEYGQPIMPQPIAGFPKYGHIDLKGMYNARDLGGLPAANGKRIKKRRLIRADDLHDASAMDIKQLVHMHDMDCVVDLRSQSEVQEKPDPLPLMPGVEYIELPVLPESAISTVGRAAFGRDAHITRAFVSHPYTTIQDLYSKALVGEMGIKAYKRFLHLLLEAETGATLWHCTQGKDRTGVAAILVEYCLGVPMEYIRDDYLATNLFISGWIDRMTKLLKGKAIGLGIDSSLEAYAYAHEFYFDAALDAMDSIFGSIDKYLENQLDFGQDKRARLRELYLE